MGVVTHAQVQDLLSLDQKNNTISIEEALEDMISNQIDSGTVCTGDSCSF